MSEQSMGPGWWQASDGRWYPPESAPAPTPPPAPGPAWGAPPPGYGYAYGPTGPAWGPPGPPSANGLCVASLISGIIGVIPCFINNALAVVALVLGIVALRRMSSGAASEDGKGMAIAGVVLGAIGTAIGIGWLILFAASPGDAAMAALVGPWR